METSGEKELLNSLSNQTNRSYRQTLYLFDLCDNDFNKLVELEEKLKNNFVHWVPGCEDTLNTVLAMPNDRKLFVVNMGKL